MKNMSNLYENKQNFFINRIIFFIAKIVKLNQAITFPNLFKYYLTDSSMHSSTLNN